MDYPAGNNKIIKYLNIKKINLLAFGLYCTLTYIMVYLPVSIDLNKTYLGHSEVVFWSNYFWWFDYALTNSLNPLHHSFIFYPLGLDMVDSIFPQLLFVPVTHFFGSVVSYNLYVLSTFVLAGYGMFLLANYLLKEPHAAFIAGIIFAFFPFHFGASCGHLHTFSVQWIPFFVLFFHKMYEDPRNLNILLASLFFAINALTSWTIAVMLAIFCLLYVGYRIKDTVSKEFLLKFSAFSLISLALIAPGLYLILKNILTNKYMIQSLGSFITYSADILGFVVPSPFHPVFGSFSNQIYSNFTGNYSENIVFIGYTVILLAIIGTRSLIKSKSGRFILICSGVFLVLSLGPVLHIFGIWQFTDYNLTIMLPGIITKYIPFLNMIRVPSRYDIVVMFCFALMAAYGFKRLVKAIPAGKVNKYTLCAVISAILIFEFVAVLPVQDVKVTPEFYYNISHDDSAPIMEIPLIRSPLDKSKGNTMISYYEYQKTHQRPFLGGYFNRLNPVYAEYMDTDPVLKYLYFGEEEIIQPSMTDKLAYLRCNYNVSYVILHKNYLDKDDLDLLIAYLGDSYTIDASMQNDQLVVYNTDVVSGESIRGCNSKVLLGGGWHGLENWGGTPTRWTQDNATLIIESNADQQVELSFNTRSFHRTKTLEIYVNGYLVQQTTVPTSFIHISIPIQFHKGKNTIRLHVPEGAERPCDIPELNNKDTRWLSVAVQGITIEEVE
ncbi:hypothetical protein [Methanoculleus sp.]|uniref:hypothetical protein n=1 Tax=Methanoculleus sp. TaxID=90427 RepID=UPI002615C74C|nr:hypothetical protein [Methanoculleus sp.]MDI6720689.1 hypothetical protein [Methanomicrobiales archaeon]MDI6867926.1 hypothetical protein [Methanoculleus sp.]